MPVARELWLAARLLARTPGFTLVATLTLGLAIGACTAIYSVVYVFATAPAQGRRFADAELREGAAPVALVSQRFWKRHFEGRGDLADATLRMRDQTYSIVGVLPPTFDFPAATDIWLPREAQARNPYRTGHNWRVVARRDAGIGSC